MGKRSQKVELKKYQVKNLILNNYGLAVHAINSIRGVLQVMTGKGCYAFKNAQELPDLPFVNHCLEMIRRNGFPFIPPLIPTLTGETNVTHEGQNYYLERWVEGHELPKWQNDEPSLGKALAHFHLASQAVAIPEDSSRNGYGQRAPFLLDCHRKLQGWLQRGTWHHEFDQQALEYLSYRCRLAYSYIRDAPVDSQSVKAAICHGSLHHENILVDDQNNIWFIDFESFVYAERVLDLAQFIHYYAYPHEWNPNVIDRILYNYQTHHQTPLSNEEHRYFLSYLAFPRRLVNSMIQYFENQPLSKKKYTKLMAVIQQEWPKERFLKNYDLQRSPIA